MNKVIHHNYWWWGESYNIVIDNGNGIVTMQIDDKAKTLGYIGNLSVVEKARNKGLGNILLDECEKLANKLGLSEIYLNAYKTSFTYEWYKRHGFVKDKYRHQYLYRLSKNLVD